MSQVNMNYGGSTTQPPVWKFPTIRVALVAAVLIGLWQYWSWGPYTVTLDAPATKMKDFVVECAYGMASFHSIVGVRRHVFIIGSGQSVICPRHFLGPFGTGVTARVYHPIYQGKSLLIREKIREQQIVLKPREFEEALLESKKNNEAKFYLGVHLSQVKNDYCREFDLSDRAVLEERYLGKLQNYVVLAGGFRAYAPNDPVINQYLRSLFR